MNIGKKANELLHNSKVKTIGTIVAGITAAALIGGCASQGVRSFEFGLFNGKYGTRGQQKIGKDSPELKQDIFNSDSQVQPYAIETYRHYPASSNGMKDAYEKK